MRGGTQVGVALRLLEEVRLVRPHHRVEDASQHLLRSALLCDLGSPLTQVALVFCSSDGRYRDTECRSSRRSVWSHAVCCSCKLVASAPHSAKRRPGQAGRAHASIQGYSGASRHTQVSTLKYWR